MERFRVKNSEAETQCASVAELVTVLHQHKGQVVEIFDRHHNRVDKVEVMEDLSVWECFGSRPRFYANLRYDDEVADPRRFLRNDSQVAGVLAATHLVLPLRCFGNDMVTHAPFVLVPLDQCVDRLAAAMLLFNAAPPRLCLDSVCFDAHGAAIPLATLAVNEHGTFLDKDGNSRSDWSEGGVDGSCDPDEATSEMTFNDENWAQRFDGVALFVDATSFFVRVNLKCEIEVETPSVYFAEVPGLLGRIEGASAELSGFRPFVAP